MKTIRLSKSVVSVTEVGEEVEIEFFGLTGRDEAVIESVVNNEADPFDSDSNAVLDRMSDKDLIKYLKNRFEPEDLVEVDVDPYVSWA